MKLPGMPYLAAGALLAGFIAGWQVQGWRRDAGDAEALQAAWKAEAAARQNADLESLIYEGERADNDAARETRETEIRHVYATRVVAGDCALDPASGRLLSEAIATANARLTGEPSSPMPTDKPIP